MGVEGEREVRLGRLGAAHGVRGWLRVSSDTVPAERILDYAPWRVTAGGRTREMALQGGRRHGSGLVAKLAGVDDRDAALALVGAILSVPRERLPQPGRDEHYWADLVGLEVVNEQGIALGRVARLMETGANDVLVVSGERERLLPYVAAVVLEVDLAAGRMRVDWDAGF